MPSEQHVVSVSSTVLIYMLCFFKSEVDDDEDDDEVEEEEGYQDLINDKDFIKDDHGPSARDINDRMRRHDFG